MKSYPSLSQNQGHTFTTRSIENNIGTVKGTLTAKDGAVTPVEFQLVKEQGEWRILFIEVRAAGAALKKKICPGASETRPRRHPGSNIVSITTCEGVAEPGMKALGVRKDFGPLSPEIHALVQLKNVKAGSELKASWVAVDAIDEPNYVIKSYPLELKDQGEVTAHFMIYGPLTVGPSGNISWICILMARSPARPRLRSPRPASQELPMQSPRPAPKPPRVRWI